MPCMYACWMVFPGRTLRLRERFLPLTLTKSHIPIHRICTNASSINKMPRNLLIDLREKSLDEKQTEEMWASVPTSFLFQVFSASVPRWTARCTWTQMPGRSCCSFCTSQKNVAPGWTYRKVRRPRCVGKDPRRCRVRPFPNEGADESFVEQSSGSPFDFSRWWRHRPWTQKNIYSKNYNRNSFFWFRTLFKALTFSCAASDGKIFFLF